MPTQNDANSSVGHVSSVAPSHTPRELHALHVIAQTVCFKDEDGDSIRLAKVSDYGDFATAGKIATLFAAAPALLDSLREIKSLLGTESPYTVKRADGAGIDLPEAIRIGDIFERADKAISKAERGQ